MLTGKSTWWTCFCFSNHLIFLHYSIVSYMLQAHEKSYLWNINQPKTVTNICQNSSIFLVLAKYLTWRRGYRMLSFVPSLLPKLVQYLQRLTNRSVPGAWGQNTRKKIIWNYSHRGRGIQSNSLRRCRWIWIWKLSFEKFDLNQKQKF